MRCWRRVCCTHLKTEAMATPRRVGNKGQRSDFMGGGRNRDSRPGCAPGGAVTFFCVAKRKSPKKRPPPLPAPSAGAAGTCGARFGRGLAKLAALKQTPALIRPKLRSSAHLEGDPGYGIGGAKRRVAPRARNGSSAPIAIRSDLTTHTTTSVSRPRRDARLRRADPAPQGPHLYAPRSAVECGSGLALFERSEFSQTPHSTSTAGSPARKRRGSDSWGGLSFGYFSLAKCMDRRHRKQVCEDIVNTSCARSAQGDLNALDTERPNGHKARIR
ncbi:hypothetical protein os1_24150 [Comamonadaceae bacterium OS-1]|nr:hypothetical protein os1_24150 [Comamonadaceae bacterium OS-1]